MRSATGRGWGPFSGGQLTAIIITFGVLLLFPIGAWAVSGSNVFVTDVHTGKHANVDGSGNLETKINGDVQTHGNLATPANIVRSHGAALSATGIVDVVQPSSGKALVITSVNLDWDAQDPSTDQFALFTVADANTCANPSSPAAQFVDLPDVQDSRVVPYVPGYLIPAGKALCATKGLATGFVGITAFGYSVSSSLAPLATISPSPSSPAYRKVW